MTNTNNSNILDAVRTLLALGEKDLLVGSSSDDVILVQVHDIDEDGCPRTLDDSDFIHYIENVFMTAATKIIDRNVYSIFVFGDYDLLVTWGYESDYLKESYDEGGRQ